MAGCVLPRLDSGPSPAFRQAVETQPGSPKANPLPAFTSVGVTLDGVTLKWVGAAGNQFQIGWTTNLLTPWTYVPVSAPFLTSPTTNFYYQDTNNALTGTKFYRLLQRP